MKKYISLIIFLSFIFVICGCSVKSKEIPSHKLKITASLFPQYDFARQIAKDKADVMLILPPGTESHSFDPSPTDMVKILDSDIFLYTGKDMEPWADKIISRLENNNIYVVDVSKGIPLFKNVHKHKNENHNHQHKYDPHIWMDPTLAVKMVENIENELCSKDPKNADFYKDNAKEYKNMLLSLDRQIEETVKNSKRKSIVFAGRFAHLYFINRYGLEYKAAFDGCSTESEPSVKRISKIISFIKENEIPYVYYEELTEPKIANSLAEQTGTKSLKFSTIHNITKEQMENNITYMDLMKENLYNLKLGLN